MKVARVLRIIYVVTVVAAFSAAPSMFSRAWADDNTRDFVREIKLFDTVANWVRVGYVTEVDPQELIHDAIRGMLSGLDVYTVFLEADDYRLLVEESEGSFGGLGIEITVTPEDQTLTVVNVNEGTPAERAGLRARDKIVEIEGESTWGITTREAVLKMRGKAGTDVEIGIARKGYADILDFKITREIIHVDSVPYYFMAADDVGYIRISDFFRDEERSTSADIEKALAELKKDGMKKLIVDLRGNSGGPLDEAVAVTSVFLKKGSLVVYTGGRTGRLEQRKYFVEDEPAYEKGPLVVLVDGSSASASEVFTGALKDHKRAVVMGEKTYGKASVQMLIPLKAAADAGPGPGLNITVAYYYTPEGHLIDGEGIEPDVELEASEMPLVVGKLFVLGYFRMFAEQYYDKHGAAARADFEADPAAFDAARADFEADPAAFDEFVAWVEERGFDFYPERYAETLPDKGRAFYIAAIEKEREAVMAELTHEVIREVAGDAEAFKYWREVAGDAEAFKYWRQHDPWVARAVEELS
jgi:carboxyl-terminal processing protease